MKNAKLTNNEHDDNNELRFTAEVPFWHLCRCRKCRFRLLAEAKGEDGECRRFDDARCRGCPVAEDDR